MNYPILTQNFKGKCHFINKTHLASVYTRKPVFNISHMHSNN